MPDLTSEEQIELQRLILRMKEIDRSMSILDRRIAEEIATALNVYDTACATTHARYDANKIALRVERAGIARKIETGEDDIITR